MPCSPKFYIRVLIFVNDLNNLSKGLDPVHFADDTNLFCSEK